MKQRSEAAWKFRIYRLRLKFYLNRGMKSAANLSRSSFCLRKSAANQRKSSAFSCKASPLGRRNPRKEDQSVARRLETLRALLPGSLGLDTPLLLEKMADYITALKMQVETMQTLANFLENSAYGAVSWPS